MMLCYGGGGVFCFEEMTAGGMTGEEVFKKIDKDGNGKVNRAELQVILEEVGFTVTPSLLTNVMLRFTRYEEKRRDEWNKALCAVRVLCTVCCVLCAVWYCMLMRVLLSFFLSLVSLEPANNIFLNTYTMVNDPLNTPLTTSLVTNLFIFPPLAKST